MHSATIKIVNAQQAKLNSNYKNTKLKLLKKPLKMILGSKHVGAVLYVLT